MGSSAWRNEPRFSRPGAQKSARHDLLAFLGIWIHVLSGLEQREIFRAKFFLQFVYLLGQVLGFLAVLVPINLIELITEIIDLAIGLGLSLITSYDASDLLCQFGRIAGEAINRDPW